jgi:hypothetical protein
MHSAHPELTQALVVMLDRMDASIRQGGYAGEPVRMFVAGGIAVHYHCGTRYTGDVDATFSRRMLLHYEDLVVKYERQDGKGATLYLDPTYNDTFALLHPDHQENAIEWQGIGNERRLIQAFVFTPLDLAVSKIARFGEQDREDIRNLSSYFTTEQLRAHAEEALDYYVGNTSWVRGSIDIICSEIAALN